MPVNVDIPTSQRQSRRPKISKSPSNTDSGPATEGSDDTTVHDRSFGPPAADEVRRRRSWGRRAIVRTTRFHHNRTAELSS